MRGRRPSRRAAIAAAIALAVVLGAGAAALVAASGDDDGADRPVASATSPSSTTGTATDPSSSDETNPTTPTDGSSDTAEPPASDTETTTAPAPPPAEPPSTSGDTRAKHRVVRVPPGRVFSGKGTSWLGTIDVSRPAVVRWSGRGKLSIRFGRERFPVVAPSHSGQLAVPPYRFELVRVISNASWRITITPQG